MWRTGRLLQQVLLVLLLTIGLVTMHALADRLTTAAPMADSSSAVRATVAPQDDRPAGTGVGVPMWMQAADDGRLGDAGPMWDCIAVLIFALLAAAVSSLRRRVPMDGVGAEPRAPAPTPSRTPLLVPVLRI